MQPLQDWLLAVGVGLLVLIDVIILVVYSLVEGVRGNLMAMRIPHIEHPEETSGVSSKFTLGTRQDSKSNLFFACFY